MNGKLGYLLAAIALFIAGLYEVLHQSYALTFVFFLAMGVCLGIFLRGRNTWMM